MATRLGGPSEPGNSTRYSSTETSTLVESRIEASQEFPDDAALARVIDGSPEPVRVLGNYSSKRMEAWHKFAPPADHGDELVLPPKPRPGVTVRYSE